MDSYDKEEIFKEKYEPFVSVHVAHNIIFTCAYTVLACDDTFESFIIVGLLKNIISLRQSIEHIVFITGSKMVRF